MGTDVFYLYGKLTYRFRWLILIVSLLVLALCIPVLPKVIQPFSSTGFYDENSQSEKANNILNKQLSYSLNRFIILYHHPYAMTTNSDFISEIKYSLANIKNMPGQPIIIYPDANPQQISLDKHTAYAVVLFKNHKKLEGSVFLKNLKNHIKKPPHLSMKIGGELIFFDNVTKQTQIDLNKAEYIGTPAAVVMLFLIFGSVVAAFLPVFLGAVCGIYILAALYYLAHIYSLSIFTINIALLMGLCVSLDYALLLISRFREQLIHSHNIEEALGVTMGTAGKSIFFSGLAVFISLSGLIFFPVNVLFSVGIGGLTAVFIALVVALVILPAVLAILKDHINSLSVCMLREAKPVFWKWFVSKVVKRPLIYFCLILAILLGLSYPMSYGKLGISNFKILPRTTEIRQFFDGFNNAFGETKIAPILAIAQAKNDNITSPVNISRLYDFVDRLKRDPRIDEIFSIVSTTPQLTKEQYQKVYQAPPNYFSPAIQELLEITTTKHLTTIDIVTKYSDTSQNTKNLIKMLRKVKIGGDLSLQITGSPANNYDVLTGIVHVLPFALLWIIVITYVILMFLLRSLILPLKAIITTILSLTASYGILVFIFQEGHLHHLLNFDPQGMLDISLCVIIFCALFGFSMDYEVFILTRIKEYYEKTGEINKSIVTGIEKSGRIITSAAIIVILICFSFMSADVLIVKAFGLGIAAAIFVDAFLIRLMLVPATMALLKDWSWYFPKWTRKILPAISFNLDKHGHSHTTKPKPKP